MFRKEYLPKKYVTNRHFEIYQDLNFNDICQKIEPKTNYFTFSCMILYVNTPEEILDNRTFYMQGFDDKRMVSIFLYVF